MDETDDPRTSDSHGQAPAGQGQGGDLDRRTPATGTARDRPHAGSAWRSGSWLGAAGVAALAFFGGMLTESRLLRPAAPPATFVLLLYGGSPAPDSAARAEAFRTWAARPGEGIVVLGGETLIAGGMAIYKRDTTLFSPVLVDILEPGDFNAPVGYFLVRAPSRQAAMRLAGECPHLEGGGRVVVRAIHRP